MYEAVLKYFPKSTDKNSIQTVCDFVQYLKDRGTYEGIFWSKAAINSISAKYLVQWSELQIRFVEAKVFTRSKEGDINVPGVIELQKLFEVLDSVEDWRTTLFKESVLNDKAKIAIIHSSKTASQALMGCILHDIEGNIFSCVQMSDEVLNLKDFSTTDSKEIIKEWLDHMMVVVQMMKYFAIKEGKIKNGSTLEPVVSEVIKNVFESDTEWTQCYDLVRNFLTRKNQDKAADKANRMKLNFENSRLASGWDLNKEPENSCIILLSPENKYYLAVISKGEKQEKNSKVFFKSSYNQLYLTDKTSNVWQKMEYKLLPGPNKMLPKCLIPKSDQKKYGISEETLEIYNSGSFKKNDHDFNVYNLYSLINFYKEAISNYKEWQCFNFNFLPTEQYTDISQFYHDVEKDGYKLNFIHVNGDTISQMVENGKIYLFEIKNQDNNKGKKNNHHNNLHTLYWNQVFANLGNKPKLNGSAEIFYRKALLDSELEKVIDRSGKEIIRHYRFSKSKFQFHVPITLNFCNKGMYHQELVKECVQDNSLSTFIGVDRGEKNLAYYTVINNKGEILDQGDLNLPFVDKDNKPRSIKVGDINCHNYCDLLTLREKERDAARKSWQSITAIKDLKKGYISQVVRKIADLILEHQAFIVLEDLNSGFKRGRQKIERSVYQNLELALAKKFNYLVQKDAIDGSPGSVTQGLQLTPLVSNYGDIKKQFGIMLYTRPNYTSITDPVTGWRKTIFIQNGSLKTIRDDILNKFEDIYVEGKDYCFTYITSLVKTHKKVWKLYSAKNGVSLDRYRYNKDNRGNWHSEKIDLNGLFDDLFRTDFNKNTSLLKQLEKLDTHSFDWNKLRFAIELLQQIRNSGVSKDDADFLHSPVRDFNGKHFDTRQADEGQPKNGDANGAYNIARKGIIMAEHVRRGLSLFIRDEEWDAYLQGKEVWNAWMVENQKLLGIKKKTMQSVEQHQSEIIS